MEKERVLIKFQIPLSNQARHNVVKGPLYKRENNDKDGKDLRSCRG